MITRDFVQKYYDIGQVTGISKTQHGSGNTHIVTTQRSKYLLKSACKEEDIEIYTLIKKMDFDVQIPNMYMNTHSNFITGEGYVLYEYLEGETFIRFDDALEKHAVHTIRRMNRKLKQIHLRKPLQVTNDWDRIRDNAYILKSVVERIEHLELSESWMDLIKASIHYLEVYSERFDPKAYQLIHMDLGPDNFLVRDGNIAGILDFTPGYNFELLSLAHFVYWNYLWYEDEPEMEKLVQYLIDYYHSDIHELKTTEYNLSLMLACIYRVIGPLFQMSTQGKIIESKLSKRMAILENVYKLLSKKQDKGVKMDYVGNLRKYISTQPIIMCGANVIIENNKGQILLHHRTDRDWWGLPGGAMELGESLEDTAAREVYEEVNLTCKNLKLFNIYSGPELYYKYPDGNEVYNVTATYICNDYEGEIVVEKTEGRDAAFFHLDEIPENLSSTIESIVFEYIDSKKNEVQLNG